MRFSKITVTPRGEARPALFALLVLLLALGSLPFARAQQPGSGVLKVSESDGSPSFNGVTELIFPAGSVTINGRTARISAGSSSGTPGGGITRLNDQLGSTQTFSRTNDTNVTLTIASASNNHGFTIGWTGTLAKARQHASTVYNDQANTYSSGFLQSFFAGASNFEFKDPTSPTKKFTFDASNITAGQTRTVNIPDASSTTAQAKSATASQWLTSMSAQGVFAASQPAFTDLSGSLACSQHPALTGDVTTSAGSCATTLANSGVSAGTYTWATVTVDAKGRVTSASSATTLSFSAASFSNSWVNYGSPFDNQGYAKDHQRVYLRGVIKSGTVNAIIFNLPAGYRPANRKMLVVITDTGVGRLDILNDGNVYLISGGNGYVNLDGLSFDL